MLMHIINYLVRILIIGIGVVLVSGYYLPKDADKTLMTVLGVVLILWGIFRILTYQTKVKQLRREQDEE